MLFPLASNYFERLGLEPSALDQQPTAEKLKVIQEAHLAPFLQG